VGSSKRTVRVRGHFRNGRWVNSYTQKRRARRGHSRQTRIGSTSTSLFGTAAPRRSVSRGLPSGSGVWGSRSIHLPLNAEERNSAFAEQITPSKSSRRRRSARRRAKSRLSRQVWNVNTHAVTYVLDEDGFYEKLADRLIENQPWSRRASRGHWLCKQLNSAAEMIDPGTYAEQAGESVRDGLKGIGLPPFMADALGAGSGVSLKIAFDRTPVGDLVKVLRALIPLVCPNMGRCPVEAEVVKTYISPELADRLKQFADS
jgi:hypothetical protein